MTLDTSQKEMALDLKAKHSSLSMVSIEPALNPFWCKLVIQLMQWQVVYCQTAADSLIRVVTGEEGWGTISQ